MRRTDRWWLHYTSATSVFQRKSPGTETRKLRNDWIGNIRSLKMIKVQTESLLVMDGMHFWWATRRCSDWYWRKYWQICLLGSGVEVRSYLFGTLGVFKYCKADIEHLMWRSAHESGGLHELTGLFIEECPWINRQICQVGSTVALPCLLLTVIFLSLLFLQPGDGLRTAQGC